MDSQEKVVRMFVRNANYDEFSQEFEELVNKYGKGVSRTEMVGMLEFFKKDLLDCYDE